MYFTEDTDDIHRHLRFHALERQLTLPEYLEVFPGRNVVLHTGEKECTEQLVQENDIGRQDVGSGPYDLLFHSEERPLTPPQCLETLPGKNVVLHTGEEECTNQLVQKDDIIRRQDMESGGPYDCHLCFRNFTRYRNLMDHLACIHTKVFPYKCSVCGKGFVRPGLLKKHAEKHQKLARGQNSSKASTDQNQKVLRSSKVFPHNCSICGKGFLKLVLLRKHAEKHQKLARSKDSSKASHHRRLRTSKVFPHSCSVCGKGFLKLVLLKKHVEKHQILDSSKDSSNASSNQPRNKLRTSKVFRHNCPLCGKEFVKLVLLRKHVEKHQTLDSEKDSSDATNHENHGNLGTGQRYYLCRFCKRKFTQSNHLTDHIFSIHTKLLPHNCTLCGKGFRRPTQLKKHKEKQHNETGKQAVDCLEDIEKQHDETGKQAVNCLENVTVP